MRKMFCLLLVMVIALISCNALASATTDGVVKYKALALIDFHLRASPTKDSRRIQEVPKGVKVRILEWDDEWCLATHNGYNGYAKTEWLYRFQSTDALKYPFPALQHRMTGYVVFDEDTEIRTETVNGVTATVGQIACVEANRAESEFYLPVWRDGMLLSDDVTYYAFADWQNAKPGDIIGGFTTIYNDKLGKKYVEGRKENIRIGCDRVCCEVEPNGEFSFNALCGPYFKSNGYKMAPNVSTEGKGYGGGVCQVTTTLYNAILQLPLQISEWHIHKYTGVLYVPQFFDAAVGTYSDLKFTNLMPYTIEITASGENGVLTILIARAEEYE